MDNNIDKLLNKLLENKKTEHPSADFTLKVMNKIYAIEEVKALDKKSVFDKNILFLCGMILIVFVAAALYFNPLFISDLISESINFNAVKNLFSELKNSILNFINLFHFIWKSSLTIITIFSLISLFLLDKILNKTFKISLVL